LWYLGSVPGVWIFLRFFVPNKKNKILGVWLFATFPKSLRNLEVCSTLPKKSTVVAGFFQETEGVVHVGPQWHQDGSTERAVFSDSEVKDVFWVVATLSYFGFLP